MRCKCESTRQRFWEELVDSVTKRHGFDKVTWRQVDAGLTPEDRATINALASLEGKPPRDICLIVSSYLHMETPQEEFARVVEDELVGLDLLMQPVPKASV